MQINFLLTIINYKIILIYLGGFTATYLLTIIYRKIAIKKNIIDIPNRRSSHSVPTPRGGGIAISIVWYIGIFYFYLFKLIDSALFYAMISGGLLFIVSLIDDIVNVSAKIRLLVQSITAIIGIHFLGVFDLSDISIFNTFLILILFFSVVWFINIFNFLDGIDGYASIEAIFVALGLVTLKFNYLPILLIACVFGFLILNWPKAKIFMGDAGSTQLGYILIVLGIYYHNNYNIDYINWAILTSVFWFDATITIIRRIIYREKLSQPHKNHAYQRLTQGGFSHKKMAYILIMINSLIVLTLYFSNSLFNNWLILLIVLISLSILYWRVEIIFPFKKAQSR